MGFWHTGYIDQYQDIGLGEYQPAPPEFPCEQCAEVFHSSDDLQGHRFESHPRPYPTLFIRGQELGEALFRVTRPISAEDVCVENCHHAILNGEKMDVCEVRYRLAQAQSDVYHLVLNKADVQKKFVLDVRIAAEGDLITIEKQFKSIASKRQLDIRVVEEFISATSECCSAIGYYDGICAYLYGVLAKEKAPDSSLPYDEYVHKFNRAAEKLAGYERPLARMIGSLIKFHFNHFKDATRLASDMRVGRAAARYTAWMEGSTIDTTLGVNGIVAPGDVDASITDWETEQILCWAVLRIDDLSQKVTDMETLLHRNTTNYDRVKLRILLAEIYTASGNGKSALQHVRELRHLPGLEIWAESMIRKHSRESR